MNLLGLVILIGLVLLGIFTIANLSLLAEPSQLNLLVATVQGPLGLILLGILFVFVALFAIYALSVRATALVETRRHMKELEAQRGLADKAEASRFTALSGQLEQEFARLRTAIDEARADTLRRVDAVEDTLKKSLDDNANAVSAHVGQVDDKLNRMAPPSLPPPAA